MGKIHLKSTHWLAIIPLLAVLGLLIPACSGSDESTNDFAISEDTLEVTTLGEGLDFPMGLDIDLDAVTYKDNVFVAEFAAGRISAIDPEGNITLIVDTGLSGPTDMLFSVLPDSMLVTEGQSNEISRIDFAQIPPVVTVTAALPQGIFPQGIATDGEFNYVTARNTTKLGEDLLYNISTNSPTAIAQGFDKAAGITFRLNEKGKGELLVADAKAGIIYIVEIKNDGKIQTVNKLKTFLEELKSPGDVAIGPGTDFVYVAETGADRVFRATVNGNETETVAKIASPSGMLFDESGVLYVSSSEEGKVFKITGLGETPL